LSRSEPAGQDGRDSQPPEIPAVLWAVFALCLVPEAVLSGADFHLWGRPEWRQVVLAYAGFWTGLLGSWQPNYPFQWVAMFASYGFIHASLSHFLLNMITLFSVGIPIAQRIGQRRFAVLYGASLVGGALGFALLARIIAPMVGASGALFGLIGAVVAWEYHDRRAASVSLAPVGKALVWLAVLNLLLWWAMNGHLAWQTHLGGFVAGWAIAQWYARGRA
jgi:rhomboid protease GluP